MSIIGMIILLYVFSGILGFGFRLTWETFKFLVIAAIVLSIGAHIAAALLPIIVVFALLHLVFNRSRY